MSDSPAPLRTAATIVVLRPAEASAAPEVLLLQRSRKVGFFPRAWVFPGGRLDPEDHTLHSVGEVPGLTSEDRPFAVAAIRECFEESGIWLGAAEDALVPDLSRLRRWAWWVTPTAEKRRYDTRFFVTVLSREQAAAATHDTRETVDSRWLTPADAIAAAVRGELFVAPPTWRTLQELAAFDTLDAIWSHAETRPIPRVMPVIEHTESGVAIRLPGHPAHPDTCHPLHAPFARSIEWHDGRWHDA
jgi:8-oxo-dGTP pyrophosphatase MutT (NUDIX family)